MNKEVSILNKKITIFKKKVSILAITRFFIQLIFLYFFSGLFTLSFTGFKSIYLGLLGKGFSLGNAFGFLSAFAATAVLSILIGRFFCGWLCAFGTYNDWVYLVSRKIFKKKIKIPQVLEEKLKYIKYIVLLGIIVFMWSMDLSPENSMNPWDAFAQLPHMKNIAPEIPVAFILLALITIGAMFIERFFCRYLCPMGAVLAIFSKFRIMKISKPSAECGKCQMCTYKCPMGINLSKVEVVDSVECISCFKCVDVCHRSNPNIVAFKKLNVKWYASTIAAILVFSFVYWGSKIVKPKTEINDKFSVANISKVDEAIFNDGVYTGIGTGFRPNLKVQVKISKGRISDIQIVSHEETEGYYEQAFEIVPKEIIAAQSPEVDVVSGATKSSNGIKAAVREALNKARKNKSQNQTIDNNEKENKTNSASAEDANTVVSMDKNVKFKDGTYNGVGTGYKAGLTVAVTIKGGKIADIKILSNNETPGFCEKAFDTVPKEIIAAQSLDVDSVSGATFSSRGIKEAVKNALQKAIISGELPADKSSMTVSTTVSENNSTNTRNTVNSPTKDNYKGLYKDGVYIGTGVGFQPDLKVSVMVKGGKIAEIKILSHNETEGFYEKPFSVVPAEIINKQNTNVDTVSGATRSSNGIISAVNDALKNARVDSTTTENNSSTGDAPSNNNSSKTPANNDTSNTINDGENKPADKLVRLYKDGRYTGIGAGRKKNLTVDVTIKDSKITNINLITYKEGPEYIKKAMFPISKEIIESQSTDVDVVSGATETSDGIKDAVNKALEKAVYKDGVFAGTGKGYNKKQLINLNVTIKEGKIKSIDMISQAETPSYFQNAWPKVTDEIIELQSTSVDTVSGATKSSKGVISAVKNALSKADTKGQISTYPGPEDIVAPFRNGVYTGRAAGYKDNLTVNVTIKDSKIIKIDLGSNDETPKYFNKVWPLLPNEIIEKQSTDVDAVSGATRSTNGVINAVKDALRQSKLALLADPTAPYKDGIYRGIGKGYKDGLNVDVTVKDNKIVKIDLKENNETPAYFQKAWIPVATAIIDKQSTKVDAVSGATRSSNGIMNAVKDALRKSHDETLNL